MTLPTGIPDLYATNASDLGTPLNLNSCMTSPRPFRCKELEIVRPHQLAARFLHNCVCHAPNRHNFDRSFRVLIMVLIS